MSIDRGKLLAVVEEMTAPLVSYKFTPSQQAHITSWANKLRALAQPAEAVNPDLCPACKTWPVDDDSCPNCGREKPFTPAEVVEAKWVTDLRNEAVRGSMKDVYWLSRDQVFELIGDATGHKTPAHPDVIVARATDAAQGAVAWKPHDLRDSMQRKCSEWGAYWRAPDRHGVSVSFEQATQLLADALGVEVQVRYPTYTHPQAAPAQGDGWKLVPVEATEEMRAAFAIAAGDTRILGAKEQFRIAYAKLLAAAPSQEGE